MKYQDIKITARNDYAFKKLFSRYENKDILIEFISLVTGIKKEDFDEIKLQNKEIVKDYYDEKLWKRERRRKNKIAKELKKKQGINTSVIKKATGLSREEITLL